MKSISAMSSALIIASAILLVGNILNCGLSTLAAANLGFAATSTPNLPTMLLFLVSGVLFVLGIVLALFSISLEKKREK